MAVTVMKPKLQLVEDLERVPQKVARIASEALPRLQDAARQTGRSVAQLAGTARDKADQMMESDGGKAVKATTVAVASTAALNAAQRGVVRFATRRPLLFALGGAALVGLVIAASRRAKAARETQSDDVSLSEDASQGENAGGKYLKAEKHLDKGAKQARKALRTAEAEGRRGALN